GAAAGAGPRWPPAAEGRAAAGAADGREYPWGGGWDAAKANAKSGAANRVGSHVSGAGPCGALDLAGNVAEWTSTKEGSMRVVKGGSFLFPESACRLGWRWLEHEDLGFAGIGFRCAADAE
ncbi:MAG: SUMF1/EgtB/PvdO family nonheme iron enzyme, partial [Planctomycetes bacterium]|nr:SUMF1/EgtB/PvdO family nonheme iron enzyme [Planctomycetota bacterium]